MIYYLPVSRLLSLCTCRLYFTETQVANRGSGTSNHTDKGPVLKLIPPRVLNFLRTLAWPRQFFPNHWRHSRMMSYHCFSVVMENQKRCSSWAVILSGSSDFDIVESLEISVSIQLLLLALHRCRSTAGLLSRTEAPNRACLVDFDLRFYNGRTDRAVPQPGEDLHRTFEPRAITPEPRPSTASYHTHSLLKYFSIKKPPGGGFWLDESTILEKFLDAPLHISQPLTWRYSHSFPFQ